LRKQHNEELNGLYSSPTVIRIIKSRTTWEGRAAGMGEKRGAYRVLVGKPEENRALRRPGHRWEGNIKMDPQEVEWGAWTGMNWLRIRTGGGLL
jgi:hypothetical protein